MVQQAAPLLYLINPCLILSTAAGSTANLANLCVLTALQGGLAGNTALAGLGLAAATYLSAHPLLLLVSKQFFQIVCNCIINYCNLACA